MTQTSTGPGSGGDRPFLLSTLIALPEAVGGRAVSRFVTSDFDAARDYMCGLFRPHRIISRDRVTSGRPFELGQASLGADLTFTTVRYNRAVTIEAPPLEEFFVLQLSLDGDCATVQGPRRTAVEPGSLCVLNANQPIRQDMAPDYRQMAVKVSRPLVERQIASELGQPLQRPLEFAPDAIPLTGEAASVARFLALLWNELVAGSSAYGHAAAQKAAQQTLAALMLAALPHNYRDAFACAGQPPAPHFVRRAERFMQAHAQRKITLDDLVQETQVSLRTLQCGFRRFRNTTPMNYLKEIRLERARNELCSSWRTGKSVTEIALDCGFGHLSKFAQDYKARYGETPSATARLARA